jgi:hypothetical protein
MREMTEEQKKHIQFKRDYPYNEATEKWWVNDLECPIPKTNALIGTEVSCRRKIPNMGDDKVIV